jgi:hypothetical protein
LINGSEGFRGHNPNFNPGGEFIFLPVSFSLTPGFSQVCGSPRSTQPFNGFLKSVKPLKRLALIRIEKHRAKALCYWESAQMAKATARFFVLVVHFVLCDVIFRGEALS